MNKNKMRAVYVEGNVGSGKSTLLDLIKDQNSAHVLEEPVNLWENIDGHNLLEAFFLDQSRWAFTLQMYITVTRIDQLLEAMRHHQGNVAMIERSVFSGRYCFASNLFEMKVISDLEWVLYQKLWDRDVDHMVSLPAGFIYLRTPAQICLERVDIRNRQAEHPLTLHYLQLLEKKHDDWLLHKKMVDTRLLSVPVLVLDGSKDIIKDTAFRQDSLDKIHHFVAKL